MGDPTDAVDSSVSDALGFFKKSRKEKDEMVEPQSPVFKMPEIEPDSDLYTMNYPKRGFAVILNHNTFDDYTLSKRDGTKKDAKDLERVLKELEFDVVIYNDLKYGAIYEVIGQLANADHSQSDCLLIVVLTHGDKGKLHAKDHQYPPDFLWESFAGDKCPTLIGKPKMFFLQACRGSEVDDGVEIQMRSRTMHDSGPAGFSLPSMADILVMYSTFDGFYSWRSPIFGSWFIQCLCNELEENAKSKDLMTILTFVNRRMALCYRSNVPVDPKMNKKKQIGTISSTFTRLLYFYGSQT